MNDEDPILWPIRTDVGSAAGGLAGIALWLLLGSLGSSPAMLAVRGLVLVAAAAATIFLWSRLEEPGTTLCWTMGAFIAVTAFGGADAFWTYAHQ